MTYPTQKTLTAKGRALNFAESALLVHWSREQVDASRAAYHVRAALEELRELRTALDDAEAELLALQEAPSEAAA